jgi:hypothetical protein
MKFDREAWFQKLNLKLLELNKTEDLIYYLVLAGPLKLQLALPRNSFYIKAINSFYNAQYLGAYTPNLSTIYCLDNNYINKLPSLNITKNDLNLNNFQSRLSNQTRSICLDETRGILKVFNVKDQNHLLLCNSFDTLPSWEIYSPLKEFIHFIALEEGCWLSHAGSLCKDKKAVLLFGPGGNGKSTTTLTGLASGLQTVGDDYLLIEDLNDKFYAHAIYKTIKTYHAEFLRLHENFKKFDRQLIESTGKYVYICNEDEGSNIFIESAEIILNIGLHLKTKFRIKDRTSVNFDARYMSLSSIEQIPFWINKSSQFSEKIFQSLPNHFINFNEGEQSLNKNIEYIFNVIQSKSPQYEI